MQHEPGDMTLYSFAVERRTLKRLRPQFSGRHVNHDKPEGREDDQERLEIGVNVAIGLRRGYSLAKLAYFVEWQASQ